MMEGRMIRPRGWKQTVNGSCSATVQVVSPQQSRAVIDGENFHFLTDAINDSVTAEINLAQRFTRSLDDNRASMRCYREPFLGFLAEARRVSLCRDGGIPGNEAANLSQISSCSLGPSDPVFAHLPALARQR